MENVLIYQNRIYNFGFSPFVNRSDKFNTQAF